MIHDCAIQEYWTGVLFINSETTETIVFNLSFNKLK